MIHSPVHIIGAGLAGSEAAWTVAQAGVPVVLHEMRPHRLTPAHKTDGFAELVCSNSFRSDDWRANAVGLLHEELRRMGSIIMRCGDDNQVPAGGALAVDRDHFSAAVTRAVSTHPLITTAREEITALPPASWDSVIVATGPLTGPDLAQAIQDLTGEGELAFFDAIAPIVHRHSIDFDTAWMQSRYDKPGPAGDKAAYVNCPLNKAQYEAFVAALLEAPKTEFKDWEKDTPYFEGCLPIEVMAARGLDTLRFGPMKPVGLTDPRTGKGPHAVAQLRQDNALGTLFNMVGFQTKLKHSAQADLLRMIPGLEQAVFARLGGIHRNTFLNSPKLLNPTLQLKAQPRLRFAGQITGCEGYVESAAIGLLAGLFAARERLGLTTSLPPQTTALGALLAHVTGGHLTGGDLMGGELMGGELMGDAPIGRRATSGGTFQPMNINFGLFPPLEDDTPPRGPNGKRLRGADKARARKAGLSDRALADLDRWRAAL